MDQEHRQLMAKIKAAGGAGGAELIAGAAAAAAAAASSGASRLVIRAQVPNRLDSLPSEGAVMGGFMGLGEGTARQVTVRLLLAHAGPGPLKDIQLSVSAPSPIEVSDSLVIVDDVPAAAGKASEAGGAQQQQPAAVHLAFFAGGSGHALVPASNIARVVATWRQQGSQEVLTSSLDFELPLALFCSAVPPVKSAEFKLTLETNREPPHMQLLFHDLVAQTSPANAESLARSQGANVLGLHYGAPGSSGPTVSVLVSKSGARYRIQSDCFHAIWLVVKELTRRLEAHYRSSDAKPGAPPAPDGGRLLVTLLEDLPLQDVFDLVEAHFAARAAERALASGLERRAQQFRSVQKRLLVRFKDKTPAPLAQLDTLMEETYTQLVSLADDQDRAQNATRAAAQALSGGVQLLLQLVQLKLDLGEGEAAALRQALAPAVAAAADVGCPEVGWEEQVEASMTHLLRSALARNSKEATASVPPLAAAKDTQRLRKHISLVVERLAKGMRLVPAQTGPQQQQQQQQQQQLAADPTFV